MAITTPAVYDLNSYMKSNSAVQTAAGKEINFFPIIGYGDENPPFVVYSYLPNIPSLEAFWNRYDSVSYVIYDSNIDRMYQISEVFIDILSKGDEISQSNGVTGTDTRIYSTYFVDASVGEAIEKDGWFTMNLNFIIYYASK